MRILNVMFNKGMGGVEQVFLQTTSLFRRWGWDVWTLTHTDAHTNAELNELISPDKQLRLAPWKGLSFLSRWKLQRFAAQHKIDCVLIHNGKHAKFVCDALAYLPRVGYCHGTNPENLRTCDAVITITPTMYEQFLSLGFAKEKLVCIPHVIDIDNTHFVKTRDYYPEGMLRLGYLGRFEESKGVKTLFQSLAEIQTQHPNFELLMAGQGDEIYTAALKALAEQAGCAEKIRWLGWIRDKTTFFNKIDVLIVPSLYESFGLIILEAFAHHVPVIASNADGPSSIITPEHDGLMFPKGEAAALAQRILALTQNPGLFPRLAENARTTLKTKYLPEHTEKKLNDFLAKQTNAT